MTIEQYQAMFWKSLSIPQLQGKDTQKRINDQLRTMYYQIGLKQVKALENLDTLITTGKVYKVHLVRDEYFPQGEETVIGDNGEYITLPCFKHEMVVL